MGYRADPKPTEETWMNYKAQRVIATIIVVPILLIGLGNIVAYGYTAYLGFKTGCQISTEVVRLPAQPGDGITSIIRRESNYRGHCDIDTMKEAFKRLNGDIDVLQVGQIYVIPMTK
jgi:hypothetical protein